jgi:DNA mismatch endonuclease (patch repair protein)
MADVHTRVQRSRNMAAIGGKNTKPEMIIRQELHRQGFRFRIHYSDLPGKPDLVFPKYRAVIHINGCFWHKHECHLFKWPENNEEFWREKIEKNCVRDSANLKELEAQGWRTLVLWECALKGRNKWPIDKVTEVISEWLRSGDGNADIAGIA